MSPLDDLLPMLQWDADSRSCSWLQAIHIEFITGLLAAALSHDLDQRLQSQVATLSLDSISRIVRAPRVCQSLRLGRKDTLRQAIEAEIALAHAPIGSSAGWSALGDAWLGPQLPEGAAVMTDRGDGLWCGPILANGVPIDQSVPVLPECPRAALESLSYAGVELDEALIAKLDEAIAVVKSASVEASDAVEQLTANILLRTDRRCTGTLRSASSPAAIGRTVLINAGNATVGTGEIAEGLVHETIHAMVSCIELHDPLLDPLQPAAQRLILSPWTGSMLHPHAFLHACLVWFGLFHFWRASERCGVLVRYARTRMKQIVEGFDGMQDYEAALTSIARPISLQLVLDVKKRMATI